MLSTNNLPVVNENGITFNHAQRSITVNKKTAKFTKTEYRLFLQLQHGFPVTYEEIAYSTYNCEFDAQVREMIDKLIDRMRRKLRNTDLYVFCILGYGYLLLNIVSSKSTEKVSINTKLHDDLM